MIGKRVELGDFKTHLTRIKPVRRIKRIIVHHFWRPTAAQWKGFETLRQVRDFHVRDNGWSDVGYHVVIDPDGSIWLGRPIEQAGAHCAGHNADTVGLAYAANFDDEDPAANGLAAGHRATAALCGRFGIPAEAIFFHRDFSNKTCPGKRMDLASFRREVGKILSGSSQSSTEYIRLKIDDQFVWAANIHLKDGRAVGFEGPLATAVAAPVPADQKRLVVVRDYLAKHNVTIPPDGWRPDLGPAGTILARALPKP